MPFRASTVPVTAGTKGSSTSIDFEARMVSRVKICGIEPKSLVK